MAALSKVGALTAALTKRHPIHQPLQPILIAGPTAVGKSVVALELAELMNGEIIAVDSMQVYRGLDIGTAKPSPEERRGIPHHLIDVVDVREAFDAARFVDLARKAVAEIQARGRVPIFCGGTGLYFKAYSDGLGPTPPANSAVRAELETAPLSELVRELEERDPETFVRIDRKNRRRIVRALEVIRLTGKSASAQRAVWGPRGGPPKQEALIGLTRPREDLIARIDARVDQMFERGLIEETKRLLGRGLAENPTALQAIGYRQAVEYLRGERSRADTVAVVKQKTRQLAKRQMTWFRRQAELEWMTLAAGDSLAEIAERVAAVAARHGKLGL